ncbi:metallophosphoesterase family protein [Alicyclobacillus fodiniaquatilis]|uniref:Metallophosphoesterase family protein n=1 Tax=Alicyclobacillus fodiniaquatilis TaxID=1661150 RepID=A0ABW4JF13_9BACL
MRIAVASDLHFMAWKETLEPVDSVPGLYHALHDISLQKPDILIINGDLTNGKVRDYELAMRAIRQFVDVPVYYTMGNHEYYGYYEDNPYSWSLAQTRFLTYTKQAHIYFAKDFADTRFIFLSPEGYHPDWHDSAWLSPTQVKWFAAQVQDWSGRLFVFLHQPLNNTVVNSGNTCFQSEELQAILCGRSNTFFMSGHTHQRMDQPAQFIQKDKVHYVGGGCVLKQFPQSRFVDLTATAVTFRIRDHKSMRWLDDDVITVPNDADQFVDTGSQ